VVNPTITVRLGEEELRRLDELAQRMGVTRSDVIRDLINRFEDALRQEVEKERKRWVTMGVVGALESIILDPTLVLRFVRRNVDILGYPDFLIGMVRVRNRVIVFSHQDRVGSQLLSQVRSRVEEEIRREEAEIEREGDEDEDTGGAGASKMPVVIRRGAHQRTPNAIPEVIKHKLVTSGRAAPPIARPTAAKAVGKPVNSNEGGGARSTASTTAPDSKRLAGERLAAGADSLNAQSTSSTPRVSANDNSKGVPSPVGRGINYGPSGDFIITLVTQSYHKHRDRLLKLIEDMMVR